MSTRDGLNRREFLGSAGATAAGVIAKRTAMETGPGTGTGTDDRAYWVTVA